MQQRWPERLWLVRHGESAGNVARDAANASGLSRIDIAGRDVDVPLSERGVTQAAALGHWFAELPAVEHPQFILSSPYLRARQTAELISTHGGLTAAGVPCVLDERLREKEFGILDRLTRAGIEELYPEQAEIRRIVGKFYHRPPGGESWCDVILRMRSTLHTLSLHYAGCRVLIVTHQVVVLCLRYLLEDLDEQRILEIDRLGDVANCAITEYINERPSAEEEGRLILSRYNHTVPLRREGAPVTAEPDVNRKAR
jgi:2,3-bisphosphoglycerate-dependent phosphoglycerate mutase